MRNLLNFVLGVQLCALSIRVEFKDVDSSSLRIVRMTPVVWL